MGLNIGIIVGFHAGNDLRPWTGDVTQDVQHALDIAFPDASHTLDLDVSRQPGADGEQYHVDLHMGGYGEAFQARGYTFSDAYAALAAGIFQAFSSNGLVLTTYFSA